MAGCQRGGAPPRPAASGCRLPATARAEERWQPAAARRQMPAARLTRWRSGRSSFRASADLRAHRASAIKVAVPGETGRGARHCPADLQLPPRTAELRRRGGWCAPASAQPCARGPELVQHGRLPVWISGRAGWGHRAPAGGAQLHLRAAFAQPSPPTATPKCAAPAPPFSML